LRAFNTYFDPCAIGVMGIGYYFGIYIIHTYTFTPFVKHSLFRNGGTREIGDDEIQALMDNTPPLSPTEKTHTAPRLVQGQGQNISLRLVGKEVRVQRRNMKSDQICGGVECLGKLIKSSLGYQSISNYAAIQFGTHAIPIWFDP
jgi:hypothetical protein